MELQLVSFIDNESFFIGNYLNFYNNSNKLVRLHVNGARIT